MRERLRVVAEWAFIGGVVLVGAVLGFFAVVAIVYALGGLR
jgi:hypothetical protein